MRNEPSILGASNPIRPIATTVRVHAQPETLFPGTANNM
jgi:hypothetical protein